MDYKPYDFRSFIEEVKDKDYPDIIAYADHEAYRVEQLSYGVRGAVRARELGSTAYLSKIGEFLFYMRSGKKPAGVDEFDFQSYRCVVEKLIEKRQFSITTKDSLNTKSRS